MISQGDDVEHERGLGQGQQVGVGGDLGAGGGQGQATGGQVGVYLVGGEGPDGDGAHEAEPAGQLLVIGRAAADGQVGEAVVGVEGVDGCDAGVTVFLLDLVQAVQ